MKECDDNCPKCEQRTKCKGYSDILEYAENGGFVLTDISETYWGHTKHILTTLDIKRLINGKHLFITDGEYTHEIYWDKRF